MAAAAATTVLFSSSQSPVAFWVPFFIRFSMMLRGRRIGEKKMAAAQCLLFVHTSGSGVYHFLATALIVFSNFNFNCNMGNQWRKIV